MHCSSIEGIVLTSHQRQCGCEDDYGDSQCLHGGSDSRILVLTLALILSTAKLRCIFNLGIL